MLESFVLSKQTTKFFTTLFSIKGSAAEKFASVKCPDDAVQSLRRNGQSLQCTEIFKHKVGKRIYSRAVAKAKCEFESHRSDKKIFYCANRLHTSIRSLCYQTKTKEV